MNDEMPVLSLTTHAGRAHAVGPSVVAAVEMAERLGMRCVLAVCEEAEAALPDSVGKMIANGRLIVCHYDRDLGVNMKWFPARRLYPEAPLVCIDDDRIYRDGTIRALLDAAERFPEDFLCCAWRRLFVDDTGATAPYALAGEKKAVLHTGQEVEEPTILPPGRFVVEHWAACLHPPGFGLGYETEAVLYAPKDDDSFLSALMARHGRTCRVVPLAESPCKRDLMREGDPGTKAFFKESALGNQRRDGWARTAAVIASYERDFRRARERKTA